MAFIRQLPVCGLVCSGILFAVLLQARSAQAQPAQDTAAHIVDGGSGMAESPESTVLPAASAAPGGPAPVPPGYSAIARDPSRDPARNSARSSYSLGDLLAAAAAGHPAVAVKRHERTAAGSITQAAKLQFFPTPSIQMDALEGKQATVFRLSQPLWTGGRLTADLGAARLREARAQSAVVDAQVVLGLRVITLYQSFIVQLGRRESQQRGVARLEQLVTMIERRVASGVSAQVDLDLARSRLAQARSDFISLGSAQRSALAQLAQATGLQLDATGLVREPMPQPPEPLPEALSRSLASYPALRLAMLDEQIARIEIDQTRAALWPVVSLRAEHQAGSYAGSQSSGNRVYVTLQYTPGAGAAAIPQAAAAAARAEASAQAVEASRRDVADRVESEWVELQSALSRIPELERTRIGSSDVLESSVRLFVTGRRTWLDLLNSVRELMQTEQIEVDARATAVGASHRLRLLADEPPWSQDGVTP